MKELKPNRFGVRPAEMADFKAEPINPPRDPQVNQPNAREKPEIKRMDVQMSQMTYHVIVPQKRVRIRHPFEIYEDQLDAFKKIQSAYKDQHGNPGSPSLSDLAREAFDNSIKERVKGLKNIDISKE